MSFDRHVEAEVDWRTFSDFRAAIYALNIYELMPLVNSSNDEQAGHERVEAFLELSRQIQEWELVAEKDTPECQDLLEAYKSVMIPRETVLLCSRFGYSQAGLAAINHQYQFLSAQIRDGWLRRYYEDMSRAVQEREAGAAAELNEHERLFKALRTDIKSLVYLKDRAG